jgi:hypothetical protein
VGEKKVTQNSLKNESAANGFHENAAPQKYHKTVAILNVSYEERHPLYRLQLWLKGSQRAAPNTATAHEPQPQRSARSSAIAL